MNPIDWGSAPIWVGLVRGIIAALITGLLNTLIVHNTSSVSWETAATSGAVPMLIALLVLLGYGAADQSRANNGIAIAGDVPVASNDLKVTKVK